MVAEAVAQTVRPALHCLCYGDVGSRKSTFATTWTAAGPMLVFFFDALGKDQPYLKWGRQHGAKVEESRDQWNNPIKTIDAGAAGYIRIEYYSDISPEARSWECFEWRMKERAFFDEGWSTVTVDSLTFMEICARMYARHVVNPNTKEPRQWFGYSTDALEYALLVQLQGFPGNVLVLAHIDNNKDEMLGTFVRQVAAPGRLTNRNELAAGYAEIYKTYRTQDEKKNELYLLQTRSDNLFFAASQIEAPDPCWQDYNSLWENYK